MRINFLSSVNAKLKRIKLIRINFLSSVNAKLKQIKLMGIKFRWINSVYFNSVNASSKIYFKPV